jgi:hypothetical protein
LVSIAKAAHQAAFRAPRFKAFFPWRFMVKRKKPFNIMACQLSIVSSPRSARAPALAIFLLKDYALHSGKAGSNVTKPAGFSGKKLK